MSLDSAIEWTDATWNPVRGCTKISPGCKHCYAETFAERFRGVKGHPYGQGFDMRLVPEKLAEPLRWRSPKMIFVNSMSDLFHDKVPDDYIVAVARVMVAAKWHTYQVLTKRSERLRDLLNSKLSFAAREPHVWWGVSVEDKKHGVPRIEHLRSAEAAVRFLSVEPLLEDTGTLDLRGIHWMIVGGERSRRETTAKGVGAFIERSVQTKQSRILFQAMGRSSQVDHWPPARWPDLRRIPRASPECRRARRGMPRHDLRNRKSLATGQRLRRIVAAIPRISTGRCLIRNKHVQERG